MKIAQSINIKTKVKYGDFRYYVLVGSENSQIIDFVNQVDERNTYQSIQDHFYSRIIIPKVNTTTFKLQIHISEYYQQLYPFKNAYFFITKQDLDSYRFNIRSKPLNVLKLLQLCVIMQFEIIIIQLEKNEYLVQYQIIEQEFSEELKPLKLPSIKFANQFSIKTLPKSKTQVHNYVEVNFVVTNVIEKQIAEIVILHGALIKGQTVILNNQKALVQSIKSFEKEISIAMTNQIVSVTFDKDYKLQTGFIGCFKIFEKSAVSVEMTALKSKTMISGGIHYQAVNLKRTISLVTKSETELSFHQNRPFLHFPKFPHFICFSPTNSEILAIGTMKLNLLERKPVFLIPRKFIETFDEESETARKFISKCRMCKVQTINIILIPCGHLRYCNLCLPLVCLYCDSKVTKTATITIQEIDPQLYLTLRSVDEDYLKHTKFQVIPPIIQFETSHQEYNIKCQICKNKLITDILEQDQKVKFVCNECGGPGTQIQYS